MSYFLTDEILECGREAELAGEEARHLLKSRRIKAGEKFIIQDAEGKRFEAVSSSNSRDSLKFLPEKQIAVPPPSGLNLEILQALPKEKALDWLLQKATELGVSRLELFCGEYSPNAFRSYQNERQTARWQRVVWEACKQSGRQFPPEIHLHRDLKSALESLPECQNSWVLFPEAEHSVSWKDAWQEGKHGTQEKPHHRILVGAEGGLHQEKEVELAIQSGMTAVDLGPRILRAETAAITASAILQFLWGDL